MIITEQKIKQIINEELNNFKKEIEEEKSKDQFAHKFSSVFVEALDLNKYDSDGKQVLNEVYNFLKQYTMQLNEVQDNWITYPVTANGTVLWNNPIAQLPNATPIGVGAGGLIKLYKAQPNKHNVTYGVTINTKEDPQKGRLNTTDTKIRDEITRLLKDATSKNIEQSNQNNSPNELVNNAGPLSNIGGSNNER